MSIDAINLMFGTISAITMHMNRLPNICQLNVALNEFYKFCVMCV